MKKVNLKNLMDGLSILLNNNSEVTYFSVQPCTY